MGHQDTTAFGQQFAAFTRRAFGPIFLGGLGGGNRNRDVIGVTVGSLTDNLARSRIKNIKGLAVFRGDKFTVDQMITGQLLGQNGWIKDRIDGYFRLPVGWRASAVNRAGRTILVIWYWFTKLSTGRCNIKRN